MARKPRYTGVGSRGTPVDVCRETTSIARKLERKGYVLRSGGADGADSAFELGVTQPANKRIYLPWEGFNGSDSKLFDIPDSAFELAAKVHPAWHVLTQAGRKFHARNCQQVLGKYLDWPSEFVICWTPEGKIKGGTATAIRLAMQRGIPVYNLALRSSAELLEILALDRARSIV